MENDTLKTIKITEKDTKNLLRTQNAIKKLCG